jgi:hypothetical protein
MAGTEIFARIDAIQKEVSKKEADTISSKTLNVEEFVFGMTKSIKFGIQYI